MPFQGTSIIARDKHQNINSNKSILQPKWSFLFRDYSFTCILDEAVGPNWGFGDNGSFRGAVSQWNGGFWKSSGSIQCEAVACLKCSQLDALEDWRTEGWIGLAVKASVLIYSRSWNLLCLSSNWDAYLSTAGWRNTKAIHDVLGNWLFAWFFVIFFDAVIN